VNRRGFLTALAGAAAAGATMGFLQTEVEELSSPTPDPRIPEPKLQPYQQDLRAYALNESTIEIRWNDATGRYYKVYRDERVVHP